MRYLLALIAIAACAACQPQLDQAIRDARVIDLGALVTETMPYEVWSQAQLAATFGPAFTSAVFELAPGGWTGPLGSSFGLHLVRVLERIEQRDADLSQVRAAVRDALLSERAEAAVAQQIASLRGQYEVAR